MVALDLGTENRKCGVWHSVIEGQSDSLAPVSERPSKVILAKTKRTMGARQKVSSGAVQSVFARDDRVPTPRVTLTQGHASLADKSGILVA